MPVELAMLTSDRCAVLVALTELVALDLVVVRAGRVYSTERTVSESLPTLTADVHGVVRARPGSSVAEIPAIAAPATVAARRRLVAEGFLRRMLPWWPAVPPLVVAVVGLVGIVVGSLPRASVGVVLVAAGLGITCLVWSYRTHRDLPGNSITRIGDMEYLRQHRRYRHLDPWRRPASALYGRGEAAMATALFGPEAIGARFPALARAFRDVRVRSGPAAGPGGATGGPLVCSSGPNSSVGCGGGLGGGS